MEAFDVSREVSLDNSCGFRAGMETNGRLYFSARDRNGLYAINLETEQKEFLGFFPDKSEHDFCCRVGNELWFFPMDQTKSRFDIYNMDSGRFTVAELPLPEKGAPSIYGGKFVSALEYGGIQYIIPGTYDYIIKIKNNQVESYIKIPQKYLSGDEHRFMDALIYRECIYFGPYGADYILKMSLPDEAFQGAVWDYPKNAFGKLCEYQGKLYVIPSKAKVNLVKVEMDFSEISEMSVHLEDEQEEYFAIGCIGGTVWLFPHDLDKICRISLDEFEIEYMRMTTRRGDRSKELGYGTCVAGKDGLFFGNYGYGTPIAKVDLTGQILFLKPDVSIQGDVDYLCRAIEMAQEVRDNGCCVGAEIYAGIKKLYSDNVRKTD